MPLFNKPDNLPIDQVRAMRIKGFDNNQIVQALQRNGYSSTQIFDALNQADLVSGAPAFQGGSNAPLPSGAGDASQGLGQGYEEGGSMVGMGNEEVEELIESVIEEKWDELGKDINKIVEWKNEVENKLARIEQRFESLQDSFDKLHQAVIGKIGEYDKNILEVGAEVKAMEKVFSKVLPLFTENVSELARITQALKKGPI
ncbi:hypothetical protein JXB28_03430 [Candidatus Woesearchaeota archaeon]|nr:hypothetical protein [Candidatus Woesearchaeota archaeon]